MSETMNTNDGLLKISFGLNDAHIGIGILIDAINRVRELHKPDSDGDCTQCVIGAQYGTLMYASYPCKTIKELDNEE